MSSMTRSAYGLDVGAEFGWRQHGACRSYDPDWWTADYGKVQLSWAIRVCLDCPVRAICDQWAQANPDQAAGAVYGGIYWREGRKAEGIEPRPAQHQPAPLSPDGQVAAEVKQRPNVRIKPHEQQIREWLAAGKKTRWIAERLGTSQDSLRSFLNRRGISGRQLRPCGTASAYARHLRRHEYPCEACRDAKRVEMSKYRRTAA